MKEKQEITEQFIKAFADNAKFIFQDVFPKFLPESFYTMQISVSSDDDSIELTLEEGEPYNEDRICEVLKDNPSRKKYNIDMLDLHIFDFPFDQQDDMYSLEGNDFTNFMLSFYNNYIGVLLKKFIDDQLAESKNKSVIQLFDSSDIKYIREMNDDDFAKGGLKVYNMIDSAITTIEDSKLLEDEFELFVYSYFFEERFNVGLSFDTSSNDSINISMAVKDDWGQPLFENGIVDMTRKDFLDRQVFEKYFCEAWNKIIPWEIKIDEEGNPTPVAR